MDNNDDGNYKCNICNKTYSNYESLWKHKKMINTIPENSNDKTEEKDNCIYCNKIYNPKHVRFNLENVIDHNKMISEHEQECKSIFEDVQECKIIFDKEKTENRIAEEIKLLEIELNNCSVSSNKKSRHY